MAHVIPIDIHAGKLLDFLITRKHCNRDWPEECKIIRQKINAAIQDMPAFDNAVSLLSGGQLTYFECLKIIEILKETEANTKNIFGQYSSKKMKDWKEIVNLYEKNNIYLAEAAQILIRNVKYEIPAIKKQITKLQQFQDECNKKEHDCLKSAHDLNEKFLASCQQIGIKGENIKGELLGLLSELPDILSSLTSEIKQLEKPCNYYKLFLNHTTSNDNIDEKYMQMINYLLNHGNTTTYEWRTGECPEVIENPRRNSITIEANDNNDSLNDTIDFGDDLSSSTPNGDFVHVEKIDFGDGSVIAEEVNWGTNNESSFENIDDVKTKVACGEDALPILENAKTRTLFQNEMLELEAFLQQRILEIDLATDVLSLNLFQNVPELNTPKTDIQDMLSIVQQINKNFSTVKLQHLFLICNSPKYVDRLTENLQQKLSQSKKMLEAAQIASEKRKQSLEEIQVLEPKLKNMISKTKELQKEIQNILSKKYQNRPVNIMGEINQI